MLVEEELARHTPSRNSICTIGVFDGVHMGHRVLIQAAIDEAKARGCGSCVIAFHPHPRTVLAPGAEVAVLTTIEERVELIRSLGVDIVAPLTFTRELSQLAAREFMALLQQRLLMVGLVVGPDFALGRGREGSIPVLRELGQEMGFTVKSIEFVDFGQQRVSSTVIRDALAVGDVSRVAALLGRPFFLHGLVVHGAARGRTLGYPTANIQPNGGHALPADGIYATRVHVGERVYDSATYVGTSPTFGAHERLVEVFLLDFQGDLYGNQLKVEWVDKVRDDHTFESAAELQRQMEQDIAQARKLLGRR
ncbi:MAG: bifunctional riboflavin kinase/FAD synthetase [Chloroflexi bacterium]|nr:bifunctional riboflavin kinase/FAD synthetase [Chloroflexota bacterium]